MQIPITDGFYVDSSKPIASQECTNWIPQVPLTTALSQAQLIGTPGITEFLTISGDNPSRGKEVMNGIAYSVNGQVLYRINSDATVTSLGAISGFGKVSIANNGVQICIVVPGSTSYVYSVAAGLIQITDSDFVTTLGPSEQVKFIDGYFIHYNNNSAASTSPIFFVSNLKDGLVYDPLDFGTAEASPDAITGIHVTRNQLYIGGRETIEPFANVGGAGFPFQRISGGVVPKGVTAKFSLIDFDGSYVFVGAGAGELPAIYKFTGSSGQKISTAAIDIAIQALTDTERAVIFTTSYAENGGNFVNFHLKDRVFTFDSLASVSSGRLVWHERKSRNSNLKPVIWRVNGIFEAYGKIMVTDNQSGKIGILDRTVYTEYLVSIDRDFSLMPFINSGIRTKVPRIEIFMESGVGLLEKLVGAWPWSWPHIWESTDTNPGSNPQLTMSYSDDGINFGNETSRAIGKQGETNKRQIWRRNGSFSRFRILKFSMSDPVKPVIIRLEVDFA